MKKKRMMFWAVFLISFAVLTELNAETITYPEDFTQEEIVSYATNLTIDLSNCPYRVFVGIYPIGVYETYIWVDIYNNPEDPTLYEHFYIVNYNYMDLLVIITTDVNDRVHIDLGDVTSPLCSRARFYLGGGDDELHADDSRGRQVLASQTVMIYCGPGNDTVVGTYGRDFIYGQDGNDRLDGRGGIDYIYGGPGDDWLFGGEQDDFLWGYEGRDYLYGGPGNDYLVGGLGEDWLYGNSGDDRFYGGPGNDLMFGGEGDDEYVDPYHNPSGEEFFQ